MRQSRTVRNVKLDKSNNTRPCADVAAMLPESVATLWEKKMLGQAKEDIGNIGAVLGQW